MTLLGTLLKRPSSFNNKKTGGFLFTGKATCSGKCMTLLKGTSSKKVPFCPGFFYCFTLSGDRVFWALAVGKGDLYIRVCVFFWWNEFWTERNPLVVTIWKSSLSVQTFFFWGDPPVQYIYCFLWDFVEFYDEGRIFHATRFGNYRNSLKAYIMIEEQNAGSTMDKNVLLGCRRKLVKSY